MEDFEIYQHTIWNEGATQPLRIPVLVVANTPDENLRANVRVNGGRPLQWLKQSEEHGGTAVIVGGGPSVKENAAEIQALAEMGAMIFAINGAATWLNDVLGMRPDVQFTCDAKQETSSLIESRVHVHLLASQCDPQTIDRALEAHEGEENKVCLFHMIMQAVEDELPKKRVKAGDYVLLGGGASSGNTCLAAVYAMGYRQIHCFGFDSSHTDGKSHAYDQPMNEFIPTIPVDWNGKRFTSSVAMKAQAEKFLITGQRLQQMGCTIHVHGEGLLPTMWHTAPSDLSEQQKYHRMWMEPSYRSYSPAESIVNEIKAFLPPESVVLDLGCGTGRAALALADAGHKVTCIDFAENARDKEAAGLPFLQWDLSQPIPLRAPFGYCCDVMEHIPPEQVGAVLNNIAESCTDSVLFRIEFERDAFGERVLGTPLHLSVHDDVWWSEELSRYWPIVEYKGNGIYIVRRD